MNQREGKPAKLNRDGSPLFGPVARTGAAAGADDLSEQLLSWSRLWGGHAGSGDASHQHIMVRERLAAWLERCIGRRARGLLSKRAEDLSLAGSTPLLVAFLGRRATRELSRQVLRDL